MHGSRKHPRKNGRSRGAYEKTTRATRMGEAKGREGARCTHREATGQCWKVALVIRARESERERERRIGV